MFKIEDGKIVLMTENGEIKLDQYPGMVISDLKMSIEDFEEVQDKIKEGEKYFPLGEEYGEEYIEKTPNGNVILSIGYTKAEFKNDKMREKLAKAIKENMTELKTFNIKMGKNAIRQIEMRERHLKETIKELTS